MATKLSGLAFARTSALNKMIFNVKSHGYKLPLQTKDIEIFFDENNKMKYITFKMKKLTGPFKIVKGTPKEIERQLTTSCEYLKEKGEISEFVLFEERLVIYI